MFKQKYSKLCFTLILAVMLSYSNIAIASNWYDQYFYHSKSELEQFTGVNINLEEVPGDPLLFDETLPLLEALIKYRKAITGDSRQVVIPENGYECFGPESDNANYVFAYAERKEPLRCNVIYRYNPTERALGLDFIITSVFPEEQAPLYFAVKNGIVSESYVEGTNSILIMNHAEAATIASRLIDYIRQHQNEIPDFQRVERWYDRYFAFVDEKIEGFYYDLAEFPGAPVMSFEMYKLLGPLLEYQGTYPYKNGERWSGFSMDYICNEADYVYSEDVFFIHSYLGIEEDGCIELSRTKFFTRVEGVNLLTKVLFPDVTDPRSFGIKNNFFSESYLSPENRDAEMNHAELAKIVTDIVVYMDSKGALSSRW